MDTEKLISFLQKESKNRTRKDYLDKHNPDLRDQILSFDFQTPYLLSWKSRRALLIKGLIAEPLCETCGDYINKYNPEKNINSRFCSLLCAYEGERMSPQIKQHMIQSAKRAWIENPERQLKYITGIKRARKEGKYTASQIEFARRRREDPIFREKQKLAARNSQLINNRMNSPESYKKMVNSKQDQFSGYELPSWYHKGQFTTTCYNPKPLPFFIRLTEELNLKGPVWYGDHEKKFGRYFVDFFSETERLIIEWDEPHHRVQRQKEKDQIRQRKILDNNSDLRFIHAPQAEILIDDWGDQSYIKFKQLVMEALKSAE